jgi:hypothetical protein
LRPQNLVLDPAATITIDGTRRRLRKSDIDRVLAQAERSADGSYRTLASRALEGKPVGEFLYYGTRSDDPNDIHPARGPARAPGHARVCRVDRSC